jgi:hypothetical protein
MAKNDGRYKRKAVDRPKPHKTDEPDGVVRNKQGSILGINHEGMFYPMDGITDEDFREIEEHLLTEKYTPAETLKEEFAKLRDVPELAQMVVELAYQDMKKKKPARDRISADEVSAYLSTRDGAVHSLWLMMRKHDPSMTRQDVETIFLNCADADMHRRIAELNSDLIEKAGVPLDDAPSADGTPEPQPKVT